MRKYLALGSSVLTGLAVLGVLSVATGAPAQLVQLLLGSTVVSDSNPLPVDCVTGCSGAGGTTDVNIVEVGGNAVTTTVPVSGTVTVEQATASSLNAQVVGNVAHDAADSGNPVKVGGVAASASAPTAVAEGDRVNAWLSLNGATMAGVRLFTGADDVANNLIGAFANSTSGVGVVTAAANWVFDGTTWDRLRGDATGGMWAQGAVASGAADSGNPVKVGGRYNSTLPTLTDGQRGDLQVGTRGSLNVSLYAPNGTGSPGVVVPADTTPLGSAANAALKVVSFPLLYDGTNGNLGRSVINGTDSTGVGIAAAGLLGQFNDVSPPTITENQFGNLRMSSDGVLYAGGNVAHDAVDSGNPVKVGGYANSSAPTSVAVGDRVNSWFGVQGQQMVGLVGSTASAGADNANQSSLISAGTAGILTPIGTAGYVFDGAAWDRAPGNSTDGALVNLGANNDVTVTGTVSGTGTAGSAASGVLTVQGIASMTPLTVSDGSGSMNVIVDSGTLTAVTAISNALPAGNNNIGDVDVASSIPGTGATNLGKAEDAAHTTGDTGVAMLALQRNTPTSTAADNDYVPPITDTNQRLWTTGTGLTAVAVPPNATYRGFAGDNGLAAGTAALIGEIQCTDSVAIDTASSGNVELVALTTSETIYVCGYDFIASGAVSVQMIYGTGSACATGETNLTGPYALAANGGISKLMNSGNAMKAAVSNALCIELSGAVQVSGSVQYTKF